jgi:transposase
VKVHLALGFIVMRKGIDGLAMLVQGVLQQDPFTGHLFVFRGRTRANLIKIIYWDGTGFCLFTKRLEHGVFLWPPSVKPETLSLTSAQLSLLIEGVDWRAPSRRGRSFRGNFFRANFPSKSSLNTMRRGHLSVSHQTLSLTPTVSDTLDDDEQDRRQN